MAAPKAPKGAKSDKIWRAAIQRAVKRRLGGKGSPQALDKLADQLVAEGLAGDVAALREIGDRLDGKPTQAIAGDDDAPPVSVSLIRRVIVRPKPDPGDSNT